MFMEEQKNMKRLLNHFLQSQFCFFAIIGSIGFIIDSSLFALLHFTLGYAASRFISIFTAMTFTWLANRTLTFQVLTKPTHTEWIKYFSINSFGALINFSVFLSLVHTSVFLKDNYIIPLAIATGVSMWFNFGLSRILFMLIQYIW